MTMKNHKCCINTKQIWSPNQPVAHILVARNNLPTENALKLAPNIPFLGVLAAAVGRLSC